MLVYSMGASLDGYVADREGGFAWSEPGQDQFAFHIEEVRRLGAHLLGRRLYETMLVWETDPSFRQDEAGAAFADAWAAVPKVVFSRTLDRVEGNARLATGSVADEVAAALESTDREVAIGGPTLAAQAIAADLVDELRILRNPVVVGGGNPLLPPLDRTLRFELVETRTFSGRIVLERHRRARGA